MCNSCNKYKEKYKNFNFCPICGNKLKSIIFIPSTKVSSTKNVPQSRHKRFVLRGDQ